VTLWWTYAMVLPVALGNYPWNQWFWAPLPAGDAYYAAGGWPGWQTANTYYYFFKIPASGNHRMQLAIKSPVDRSSALISIKANVIYLLTYPDDLPNWGGVSAGTIAPPCGNWHTTIYEYPAETTRSQTFEIRAAVQGIRQSAVKIRAAIALTDSLDYGILAAIQGNPELSYLAAAAIQGNRQQTVHQRAAVVAERELGCDMMAAIGHDFDLPAVTKAAIQGHPQKYHGMRAALKGEAEKRVGIRAFVVKSRVDQIYLEFENKWPQEFGFTTIPNNPSRTKDYQKDGLG